MEIGAAFSTAFIRKCKTQKLTFVLFQAYTGTEEEENLESLSFQWLHKWGSEEQGNFPNIRQLVNRQSKIKAQTADCQPK